MRRFIPIVCSVFLAGAATVLAASGPGTKNVTLNIRGTSTTSDPTAKCTVGFSDQCPSGECACFQISGPSATGNVKGISLSNFFVTQDFGVDLADEQSPTAGEPRQRCNPIYASVDVASAQFNGTLNILGVICKHFVGISASNPGGSHDKNIFSGAWGISSSPAPSPPTAGGGLLSGTVVQSSQALSLKLSGPVSQ